MDSFLASSGSDPLFPEDDLISFLNRRYPLYDNIPTHEGPAPLLDDTFYNNEAQSSQQTGPMEHDPTIEELDHSSPSHLLVPRPLLLTSPTLPYRILASPPFDCRSTYGIPVILHEPLLLHSVLTANAFLWHERSEEPPPCKRYTAGTEVNISVLTQVPEVQPTVTLLSSCGFSNLPLIVFKSEKSGWHTIPNPSKPPHRLLVWRLPYTCLLLDRTLSHELPNLQAEIKLVDTVFNTDIISIKPAPSIQMHISQFCQKHLIPLDKEVELVISALKVFSQNAVLPTILTIYLSYLAVHKDLRKLDITNSRLLVKMLIDHKFIESHPPVSISTQSMCKLLHTDQQTLKITPAIQRLSSGRLDPTRYFSDFKINWAKLTHRFGFYDQTFSHPSIDNDSVPFRAIESALQSFCIHYQSSSNDCPCIARAGELLARFTIKYFQTPKAHSHPHCAIMLRIASYDPSLSYQTLVAIEKYKQPHNSDPYSLKYPYEMLALVQNTFSLLPPSDFDYNKLQVDLNELNQQFFYKRRRKGVFFHQYLASPA